MPNDAREAVERDFDRDSELRRTMRRSGGLLLDASNDEYRLTSTVAWVHVSGGDWRLRGQPGLGNLQYKPVLRQPSRANATGVFAQPCAGCWECLRDLRVWGLLSGGASGPFDRLAVALFFPRSVLRVPPVVRGTPNRMGLNRPD